MSITDRNFSGRTYDIKNFYPLTMLSLNEIFKESMRKIVAENFKQKITVRCENLPAIRGNREDVLVLVEQLLKIIVSLNTASKELYLFIDCEEANEKQSLHLSEGFKTYCIKFRTNISHAQTPEEQHEKALDKCRKIISVHNAIFLVNSNNQNGCIFSITLPGKY